MPDPSRTLTARLGLLIIERQQAVSGTVLIDLGLQDACQRQGGRVGSGVQIAP
jgi:hypothetical protein